MFSFQFYSSSVKKTIAAFVGELRTLSEFCNFGEKLDDMLRDRIVCGITHTVMQRCLLSETDLTLVKMLEVAQGLEAAEKSSKVMQEVEEKPLVTVQRIQQQKMKSYQNCYRCRGQHLAQTCFFRERSVMYVIDEVTLQKCVGVGVSNSTLNRGLENLISRHIMLKITMLQG